MANTALVGSERKEMRGAKAVGNADPAERIEVSVLLRRSNADALKERMEARPSKGGGDASLPRGV